VRAQAVVGADGIWSTVRESIAPDPPHEYLGVVVILGFCPSAHPMTDRRIFQTLDGETRIYVMPFCTAQEARALDLPGAERGQAYAMWQLSFPVADVAAARDVCSEFLTLCLRTVLCVWCNARKVVEAEILVWLVGRWWL
jgi:2-polyprenyl-6-methoxyphenol hydroxylase-like FAD-dependent oxidoreductase